VAGDASIAALSVRQRVLRLVAQAKVVLRGLTVWTVAVVALVLAGVIEAEGESDYWISKNRAAMAVVCFGLLVWSAGFLLISLVAWRINRIRCATRSRGSAGGGISHRAFSQRL
jgi:hypothetical protein